MAITEDPTTAPGTSPGPSVVRIPLYERSGAVRDFALVDRRLEHLVRGVRWYVNSQGYAARQEPKPGGGQRTVLMAREIMGLAHGDPLEVDHVSRDKLDNRRCNLRVATHAQNAQNRQRRGGSSEHRGVSRRKGAQKRPWQAYGCIAGKTTHLGFYETEEEAAEAAAAWRREHLPFAID